MKISRSDIDRVYNTALTENNASGKKANNETTTSKDKIVLSDKAKEYSTMGSFTDTVIKEVTKQTPPDKLLKLKNDIASGNYNVPSEVIANSILGIN